MTTLDDTRHCPMCEDAAKKILELEQRVKVLTDAGNSALKYIEDLERQCGIIACSTTGELRIGAQPNTPTIRSPNRAREYRVDDVVAGMWRNWSPPAIAEGERFTRNRPWRSAKETIMRTFAAILLFAVGVLGVIASLWLSHNDYISAFVVGQLGGLWMVVLFVAAHKTLYKW